MSIKTMKSKIDAYEQFFEFLSEEEFVKFGLKNIIPIDKDKVREEWKKLLDRINAKSDDLYVRDFGRGGAGNKLLSTFYEEVFGIKIKTDPTNNSKPTQLLQKLTGYRKNKNIFNYQVSHVFGNTKNVYCFTAPWNIVFIPKIIDPFTGHESKGDYVNKFQKKFQEKIYQEFKDEIDNYNEIIDSKYKEEIEPWIKQNVSEKDKNNIRKDFLKISIID
ncbi:hypothetical protein EZS27_022975 [termite gut metagenome]|uniref:Uncharacterized protein n=1 Tax=termite gut metagenome TaxID=433724 RepID=A0A5J4R300_9ZZZZ